jgi:hypothetical protein
MYHFILVTQGRSVAENFSYVAENAKVRYGTLHPTHWTLEPDEGI